MAKKILRYYWDSSCFLAVFKEEAGRVEVCKSILNQARNERCLIVTSSFALVEVIHIQGREKLTPDSEMLIEEFFQQPYI